MAISKDADMGIENEDDSERLPREDPVWLLLNDG